MRAEVQCERYCNVKGPWLYAGWFFRMVLSAYDKKVEAGLEENSQVRGRRHGVSISNISMRSVEEMPG